MGQVCKRLVWPSLLAAVRLADYCNEAEGDQWQRHRKITAPSFNERVSASVWAEAQEQAREMLVAWVKDSENGIRTLATDVNQLTIRVFSFAGIGIKHVLTENEQHLTSGYSMAYGDALTLILDNLIFLALLPARFITSPMLPARLRNLGTASKEFKKYMEDIVSDERGRMPKDTEMCQETKVQSLANALVQASETAKLSSDGHYASKGLSDDEIYGNLFIYNVAGYATTAGAITYAIALLAAYPQWQGYIAEELNDLSEAGTSVEKYEEIFPRLKRCLAVMVITSPLSVFHVILFSNETGVLCTPHGSIASQDSPMYQEDSKLKQQDASNAKKIQAISSRIVLSNHCIQQHCESCLVGWQSRPNSKFLIPRALCNSVKLITHDK